MLKFIMASTLALGLSVFGAAEAQVTTLPGITVIGYSDEQLFAMEQHTRSLIRPAHEGFERAPCLYLVQRREIKIYLTPSKDERDRLGGRIHYGPYAFVGKVNDMYMVVIRNGRDTSLEPEFIYAYVPSENYGLSWDRAVLVGEGRYCAK